MCLYLGLVSPCDIFIYTTFKEISQRLHHCYSFFFFIIMLQHYTWKKNCSSISLLKWIAFGLKIKSVANDRSELNKQIQLLEKYIHSSNLGEERQKSHFSTSMATPTSFVYETPQQNVFSSGPNRYDAQGYMGNGTCESTFQSIPFSSADKYGMPSGPVEREAFIPKIIEVNYIEGSGDKRWSSQDFPWTKKLEVFNELIFSLKCI